MGTTTEEIIVVGAGPCGLLAAREAARHGSSATVLEEDNIVGVPEKCAGLYSLSGLKLLDVPLSTDYLQNKVRGAIFQSPAGKTFEVDAGRDVAIVSNRTRFDQFLARQAIKEGANLRLRSRVTFLKNDGNGVEVSISGKERLRARVAIDAEGREGLLARKISAEYSANDWLPIIQCLVANHGLDKDFVYLYFKDYLKDFFGYLVPVDEYSGKLGVAMGTNIIAGLNKFMREEFPKAKVTGLSSSSIYVGKPQRSNLFPIVVAGDAAGQVKATTGGGVIFGGLCGRMAGRLAARYCETQSKDEVTEYQRFIERAYSELGTISLLRRFFAWIKPNHYDTLFNAIGSSRINVEISKLGDMDFQKRTILKLFLSRRMPIFLSSILRSLLFHE